MPTPTARLASVDRAAKVGAACLIAGVLLAVIGIVTGWTWLAIVVGVLCLLGVHTRLGSSSSLAPARWMQDDTSDDADEES